MSSGRFASLNEAELDQITDSRLSQNTKNATKYVVKTFRSYLLENQNKNAPPPQKKSPVKKTKKTKQNQKQKNNKKKEKEKNKTTNRRV